MNKILKVIVAIFKVIYRIIDKLIVTPISKVIYKISLLGKGNTGKLERILNRPIILLYLSLLCAIGVFVLIDAEVINLVDNEAEIIDDQPVNIIYNEENYVVEGVPDTIDITLIGSKSNLYLAKQIGDHKVELDLTDYTPGTYKVKLKYNHSMNNVSYKLDPSTVQIKISEKDSEVFNLSYDLLNENKIDKKLNISSIKLNESEIIVKGSKETLSTISNVKALIDLEAAGLTNKGEYTVDSIKLIAYDNKGEKVENVEMVPNNISATINVDSYSVELPVKVVTTGKITTGYALSSITSTVSKVTVYGDQSVLDTLTSIEAKIDVNGLSTDKTYSGVTLVKPSGVRHMSESTTSVTVTLDTESSKEFTEKEIEFKNLANGYKVGAVSDNDKKITVIAKGVSSALESFDATKIKAYIDLTGYTAGTHEVEVKLETDDSRFTLVSQTTKVKIVITKE
ncbi:MAG: hypothetical protein IJD92_03400 [Bacilli bacterium]|nr:hypothetical protein [Bacilli bacterium]